MSEYILKLVRLYTFYSPIRKGKYRLYEYFLKRISKLPPNLIVKTKDGRRLNCKLDNKMFDTVFFLGEYEFAVSKIVSKIIERDFICVDAGANYGWYATMFSKLGAKQVHAFEPVPPTFADLQANYDLAGKPQNLKINNLALGDEEKTIELHIFESTPNGHASISTQGKKDYVTYPARMTRLDTYLEENNIERVDFIKVDVEGAELAFLEGAGKIFKQKTPPVLMMEMAHETSRHFGYKPQDLIEFIKNRAEYDFYAIDDFKIELKRIEGFADSDIGANVLCFPKNRSIHSIREFILNE